MNLFLESLILTLDLIVKSWKLNWKLEIHNDPFAIKVKLHSFQIDFAIQVSVIQEFIRFKSNGLFLTIAS